MSHLELFGSLTSPYVRRVRIIALELGLELDWVDTTTEAGQAALRKISPLWKVPVARVRGQLVLDSAVISQLLLSKHGPGPLAAYDPADVDTRNLLSVIDGALDSLINTFYLKKDGVEPAQAAYIQKQHERAAACFSWLEERVRGPWLTSTECLGLPEIALLTALEWMTFRNTYDVSRHPKLAACVQHHATRASITSTAPPA